MTARIALGFRALRGGSVVVCVAVDRGEPRVILSSFLATAAEGDRLSLEPYHVAAETKRGPDGGASAEAKAMVAEARKEQDALAAAGLTDILRSLREEEYEPAIAALLVNRAGWITDLLEYSLAFADHAPVAEGLAVRDVLRVALRQAGVDTVEIDEKSLPERAAAELGLGAEDIAARLTALGTTVGRPWRKEQKHACLAAWLAAAGRR